MLDSQSEILATTIQGRRCILPLWRCDVTEIGIHTCMSKSPANHAEARGLLYAIIQSYSTILSATDASSILLNLKQTILSRRYHICTAMTSILSNAREQFGHFRIRFAMRSSTQLLQKRCPQVFSAVFLKLDLHTVQSARV